MRPWLLFEEGPEPPASLDPSLPAPLVRLVSIHKLASLGWPLERLKLALPLVPPSRREKISRLKMASDQARSLAGGLILALYAGVRLDEDLKIGPFGRPELAQGSPSISLSHSGDYVALALFGRRVGADVEEIRPRSPLLAGRLLSPDEKRELDRNGGSPAALIALWTRKESLGKADGRGLSLTGSPGVLSDFASLNGRRYRLWTGLLPGGAKAALCPEQASPEAVLSIAAEVEKGGPEGLRLEQAQEPPAIVSAERQLAGFLERSLEKGSSFGGPLESDQAPASL